MDKIDLTTSGYVKWVHSLNIDAERKLRMVHNMLYPQQDDAIAAKRTVDFTGSVSHDTMREQDLIPAFLDVLKEFNPDARDGIIYRIMYGDQKWDESWGLAITPQERAQQNYDQLCEDEDDTFWTSEEATWAMEEALEAMEEIAPKWHYFGDHPGDGSDFGFWLWEECQSLLWDLEEFAQVDYSEFSPVQIVRTIADKLISVMSEFANREVGFHGLIEARRTAKSLLNRLDDIVG